MKKELEKIYQSKDKKKKNLFALKNEYLSIIYGMTIEGAPLRKIHKALYDATINKKQKDKYLLAMMIKLSNKAHKVKAENDGLLALMLLDLIKSGKYNDKAKKIVNTNLRKETALEKDELMRGFINKSRDDDRWFYLASSHNDCAKDHKDYQGKIYVDDKAPKEVIDYAKNRGLYTLQWVMSDPVWFITRPNCRHYFVALKMDDLKKNSVKNLKKRYKTHSEVGDKKFQTPKTETIAEYEDRLKMLKELYKKYPTEELEKEILKTELLIKKWKKTI